MRADELMHFPFFKECGGGILQYMPIIILYCALRTLETLWNIRNWRNVNLLYEVKFYRRKPHRFLQQEKVKKASEGLQSMCQTQPLILMNDELYFYIIEMIYEKRSPCSRTKYEWTVVNLLALFAELKSGDLNYD